MEGLHYALKFKQMTKWRKVCGYSSQLTTSPETTILAKKESWLQISAEDIITPNNLPHTKLFQQMTKTSVWEFSFLQILCKNKSVLGSYLAISQKVLHILYFLDIDLLNIFLFHYHYFQKVMSYISQIRLHVHLYQMDFEKKWKISVWKFQKRTKWM